ncbi:MAG: hypothetical protein NZM40_05440 [Sphingomonadaceae bacterium]|uniref:hypothetical protein n=1 Tax=Thermaurantiacus sp. TaxID=2820283 RepID=UPI00298EFA9E|nr:hypothetical protein [Thermaurantiacus sp.]MCS6986860.1 hypothetical protein [Sphingomonadaceae bacterium]MDW8415540.1 hypothetical protein [Thermaurantiacus sp.]
MLVLPADAQGGVRRNRLERADRLLEETETFRSMGPEVVANLIHRQTPLVDFARDAALDGLPDLQPTEDERKRAGRIVTEIARAGEGQHPSVADRRDVIRARRGVPEEGHEPSTQADGATG